MNEPNFLKEIDAATISHATNPLSALRNYPVTVLVIDDQLIIIEAVRRMLAEEHDIVFHSCSDPSKAIQKAIDCQPTVILQDLVMPNVDGLVLVQQFRANPSTRDIPLAVLSSKEDPLIKAQAFGLGANDYMVKLPNKLELIARIRYHSDSYIRLLQRNEAFEKLAESQSTLSQELAEAADYVRTLIPPPLDDAFVKTSWMFIPSTQLGGDSFGYHWVNPDNLALYLIDVCGHGIGAALLSISVVNILRAQNLPNTNFLRPSDVLSSLNESFPMERHNNMLFSIWYGIYNVRKRQITYSSGGHPPAILFSGNAATDFKVFELTTGGMMVGAMSDSEYRTGTCEVGTFNKLYVISDGVYEISKPDGTMLQLSEFVDILTQNPQQQGIADLSYILQAAQNLNGPGPFLDDYSIMEFVFK